MLGEERTTATAAGVYDWFLGGRHHVAADRKAAIDSQRSFPLAARVVKYNREFLQRAVRYLAAEGVRQFLDIGSGYPTVGSVHEIAPGSRVVYVDYERDTVEVSRRILAGNPDATSIHGDLREPDGILSHPEVCELLDFTEPVGLLIIAVLHFLPDELEPVRLVQRYLEPLSPGSHLVLSHGTPSADERGRRIQDEWRKVYNHTVAENYHNRTLDEVAALFAGAPLVAPGLVPAADWRPDDPAYRPDPEDEARQVILGGVAKLG